MKFKSEWTDMDLVVEYDVVDDAPVLTEVLVVIRFEEGPDIRQDLLAHLHKLQIEEIERQALEDMKAEMKAQAESTYETREGE